MQNKAMERKIREGEAIDLSRFERTPEGYYKIPPHVDVDGVDLCDATTERWIWSVGKSPEGEVFASLDSNFYPAKPGWECVWLR